MSHTDSQKIAPVPISDRHGEEFIATASPVHALSSETTSFLTVIAPATLPEGYTFEAEANGKTITVTVPKGGVQAGQTFSVPLDSQSNAYAGASAPPSSVPVGHWKVSAILSTRIENCARFASILKRFASI
ncbi:hypothetical protein ACHAWX_006832 [Stephanocyclus meneghinianus]